MYPLNIGLAIEDEKLWDEVQACVGDLSVSVLFEQRELRDSVQLLDKIERLSPEVLLVDVANLPGSLEEAVGRLKHCQCAPKVIALHQSSEPETILTAIRAGADEYLYPPFVEGLRKALARISGGRREQPGAKKGGRSLGFLSAKGGCGATTIACHTAVELARQTKQGTLLADFDMDAGMVGFLMKSRSPYSVVDALSNTHRLDLSYWKALVSNGTPGLSVIKAPGGVPQVSQHSEEEVRHVFTFSRYHYDWTVADLGRGLNGLSMTALEALDEAYIVTTLDVPALHQVKQVVQTLLNSGYGRSRMRLVLNRVPKNPEVTPSELETILDVPVYAMLPNDYAALYESYAEGQLLPASSNLGKRLARLAAKIAGIPEESEKRKFSLFG